MANLKPWLLSLIILGAILCTCYQYVFSFTLLHNQYRALVGVGMIAQVEGDGRVLPPDQAAKDQVLDVILKEYKEKAEEVRLGARDTVTPSSSSSTSTVSSTSSMTSASDTDDSDGREGDSDSEAATNTSLPLCSEIPPHLVGRVTVNLTVPSIASVEAANPLVWAGGENSPDACRALDHVAIVVPYRDRGDQLATFLGHIHPFLARQQLHYRLYIINQAAGDKFNRAMLMNVGFREALQDFNWDCFIFHDVDLLPEDDRNLYTCPDQPRHMSVAVDKFKYRLPYKSIFGGVAAITRRHFKQLNGFSNMFWGWGGEDDDMSRRIKYQKLKITRYSKEIARYTMIRHKQQPVNKERVRILKSSARRHLRDGLNSLRYEVLARQLPHLYTNVTVQLEHREQQYNPHLSKYQASLRRKDVEMIHRRQNQAVNTKTKAKAV